MTTQATIDNETNSRMSGALETASKIAEVGIDFGLLKKKLDHAVEDAVLEAERMAKHGRHDLLDKEESLAVGCIRCRCWTRCRAVCRMVRVTTK